jgi:hypothetical protein
MTLVTILLPPPSSSYSLSDTDCVREGLMLFLFLSPSTTHDMVWTAGRGNSGRLLREE